MRCPPKSIFDCLSGFSRAKCYKRAEKNLFLVLLVVVEEIIVVVILFAEWPPKEPESIYSFQKVLFLTLRACQLIIGPEIIDKTLLIVAECRVTSGVVHHWDLQPIDGEIS